MKPRKPRAPRNMLVKQIHESGMFKPKVVPAKKGKGVIYSRKGRNPTGSGPYSFGAGFLRRFLPLRAPQRLHFAPADTKVRSQAPHGNALPRGC